MGGGTLDCVGGTQSVVAANNYSPQQPQPRIKRSLSLSRFYCNAPESALSEMLVFDHALTSGYWWLSPTPKVPSIGFGNIAPRVVLWAHLRQNSSGKEFIIFNTHIDHRSPTPMVELCKKLFSTFAEKYPSLIFIGDLNFNEKDPNYESLVKDGWHDSCQVSKDINSATFLYEIPSIPGGRIDHILYKSAELTPILWQRLMPSDPKQRISDHDPVNAKLRFG